MSPLSGRAIHLFFITSPQTLPLRFGLALVHRGRALGVELTAQAPPSETAEAPGEGGPPLLQGGGLTRQLTVRRTPAASSAEGRLDPEGLLPAPGKQLGRLAAPQAGTTLPPAACSTQSSVHRMANSKPTAFKWMEKSRMFRS